MGLEDDFLLADADDEKTIEFIKNYLPQELKEKFSDADRKFPSGLSLAGLSGKLWVYRRCSDPGRGRTGCLYHRCGYTC